MFFSKPSKQQEEHEDDLETLVLRLETSCYTEDKIDTLKLLYEYSLKDPISTGTYSLNSVIDTMKDLDDISYNVKILKSIFSSGLAFEFIDLFLKREENLNIIINCWANGQNEVNQVLELMSIHKTFKNKLIQCKNISFYLVTGLDNDNFKILMEVIPLSQNFRQQLIFDGIFEKLLLKLQFKYVDWCMKLICLLLRNNHFGQNYFIETNWTTILKFTKQKTQEVYDLLICMVDLTNTNIKYIKENVYKVVNLKESIEKQQYYFCYLLISNDALYLKDFIEIFNNECTNFDGIDGEIDRTILLLHCFTKNRLIDLNNRSNTFQFNSALLLLSEVLFHIDKSLISKADKYLESVGIVESKTEEAKTEEDISLEKHFEDTTLPYKLLLIFTLRELSANTVQVQTVNIDSILYILFAYDTTKVQSMSSLLTEIIYDDTQDENLISFCVLACLMHDIRLNMNNFCLLKHLKRLRFILSSIKIDSEFFIIDECSNILIDKVNELVFKLSERSMN